MLATTAVPGYALDPAAKPKPAALEPAKPKAVPHVYLLRGFMNVFSLGMDGFAEELQAQGILATVHNHLMAPFLADEAAENYKSGRERPIILIGHSLGAGAVVTMVERLEQQGVPVALAVTLDTGATSVSAGHVARFINFYISDGMGGPFHAGPQFSGLLTNIDLAKRSDIGHLNIDKLPEMHKMLMGYITQALAAERRPAGAKPAQPAAGQATPAAAPVSAPSGAHEATAGHP